MVFELFDYILAHQNELMRIGAIISRVSFSEAEPGVEEEILPAMRAFVAVVDECRAAGGESGARIQELMNAFKMITTTGERWFGVSMGQIQVSP